MNQRDTIDENSTTAGGAAAEMSVLSTYMSGAGDRALPAEAAEHKMPIALLALSLAVFSVGTAELIIAGILPNLSADFGIDIPTAGLLVTAYAVAVAIGGPIFAMLTTRLPRKQLIVAVMMLFVVGQVLCALAPSYGWLMAARILVARAARVLTYQPSFVTPAIKSIRGARCNANVSATPACSRIPAPLRRRQSPSRRRT